MKNQNSVYFYPKVSNVNDYLKNTAKIWELAGFQAIPLSLDLTSSFKGLKTKKELLVLNWYEDKISYFKYPFLEFVRRIVVLLLIFVQFKKIIWVRHNFQPHNGRGVLWIKILNSLLKLVCTEVVTHRPVKEFDSTYVPHPLYQNSITPQKNRDIDFLYFGGIQKYKRLDVLLETWPQDSMLWIRGKCLDPELEERLYSLIKSRNLDVDYINEFLPTEELDNLICRSKFVVLPHSSDAMIVSGAFYHAASLGANIVIFPSDFANYIKEKFSFVNVLKDNIQSLNDLSYVSAEEVQRLVKAEQSNDILVSLWTKLFIKVLS